MNSQVFENLYKVYFTERLTASLLIDFWLIYQTCKVMSLLKTQTENGNKRSFKQEKRRINFIYWSFVVSYISYSIADMGQIIYNAGTTLNIMPESAQALDLTMFIAFVYIPIFAVLLTHLRNYSSVRSLLKMVWADKKGPISTQTTDTIEENGSSA